jgi:hypothetical protein
LISKYTYMAGYAHYLLTIDQKSSLSVRVR